MISLYLKPDTSSVSPTLVSRCQGTLTLKPLYLFSALLFIFLSPFTSIPLLLADDGFKQVFSHYIDQFPDKMTDLIQSGEAVSPEMFCIVPIYQHFKTTPLWVSKEGPAERGHLFLTRLINSDQDGLDPSHYRIEELKALFDKRDPESLAKLDVMLTFSLLTYLGEIQEGRRSPKKIDPGLFTYACDIDINATQAIKTMIDSTDFVAFLNSYIPKHPQYLELRRALAEYRSLAQNGGWPHIQRLGPLIRPGENDDRIPAIRLRLTMTGDLASHHDSGFEYDIELQKGVQRFQERHSLKVDAIIGPETISAMNVSVETRIRQIVLNMERWRWHKHDLGEKYVLVDIAGFRLQGVEESRTNIEMSVIVGKSYQQTPVFSDQISYIEFNPYWSVPSSIIRKEIFPKLLVDPGYLIENHIRVFSGLQEGAVELDPYLIDWQGLGPRKVSTFRLRQDPGPWNVLGTVKFMFPNKYNVYLHDTLTQDLFKHPRRTFSHGCIRVAEPLNLARFVLGGEKNGWPPERINTLIKSGERTIVRLPEPVFIHIAYRTVWLDPAGLVHFRNDVYDRDRKLMKALFEKEDEKKDEK